MSSLWSESITWISENLMEFIAVVTGIIYVLFTIRVNILLWLFGTISSALYIWVFYDSGIYAFGLLYIYYVVMGIYGWIKWAKDAKTDDAESTHISKIPAKSLFMALAFAVVLILAIYYILSRYTDSDMPLTDAVMTTGGMIATWMLTQKYIEQWLVWIVADSIAMFAMISKGLYFSFFLFLVYTILAILGYIKWRKDLQRA